MAPPPIPPPSELKFRSTIMKIVLQKVGKQKLQATDENFKRNLKSLGYSQNLTEELPDLINQYLEKFSTWTKNAFPPTAFSLTTTIGTIADQAWAEVAP